MPLAEEFLGGLVGALDDLVSQDVDSPILVLVSENEDRHALIFNVMVDDFPSMDDAGSWAEQVASLGKCLRDQPEIAGRIVRNVSNPVAVAVFSRAVTIQVDTADEVQALRGLTVEQARQHPGRVICHNCMVMDLYGQAAMLSRQPDGRVMTSQTLAGAMFHGLRAIVEAVVPHLPDNERYRDALATSFVDSVADTIARYEVRSTGRAGE